jgi:ADP-ribose pyrophosphatase YjhB (NUDIX family)
MRIAAYVVCQDDSGRFLLARFVPVTGDRQWTLPGGGLDPGEHPEDGALRELAEETGYTGVLDALLDVDTLHVRHDDMDGYAIRVIYRARVTGGTLTAEVDGTTDLAQWMSRDGIAALDSVSLVGTALRMAHRAGRALPTRRPPARIATALDPPPALAVRAVLSRPDGRVLLMRRGTAACEVWDLPGGLAEHGESLTAALTRLLAAAAGVEARVGATLTAGLDDLDGIPAVRVTCTAATDVERPPQRSDQRWATPDELDVIQLGVTPLAQDALRSAAEDPGPRSATAPADPPRSAGPAPRSARARR